MIAIRAAMALTAMAIATSAVHASELNVISAGAVRGVVGGMIEDYSRQTGIKFNFTTGPTGLLRHAFDSLNLQQSLSYAAAGSHRLAQRAIGLAGHEHDEV